MKILSQFSKAALAIMGAECAHQGIVLGQQTETRPYGVAFLLGGLGLLTLFVVLLEKQAKKLNGGETP